MTRKLLRGMVGVGGALLCLAVSAPAQEPALRLEDLGRGAYQVEGSFSVAASSEAAWSVLTDYDRIAGFVSGLRASRVLEREQDHVLVEQEASARFLLFSRRVRVLLKVREQPMRRIAFEDIEGRDFAVYAGSWEILEEGEGRLKVVYRLKAKRLFAAPDFIARGAFKASAAELLDEVRREILLRSSSRAPQGGAYGSA